jgi:O-antigen/teichoic acid export membrane protein
VGARYVPHSYPVLVVMIIPFALMLAQAASTRILFGLGKHQTMASITVIEGIANLILSIALVRPLGIVGDALGTAIPLSFTCLVFLPRHLKKQIGVPVGTFLREAYTLPILLTVPLVGALWLANRYFYPRNLIQLTIETSLVTSVYAVGLFWAYRTNRAFHVAEIAGLTKTVPAVQPPQAVVSVEYQNEQ